ncbi:hypothetical protein EVAR_65966_1 [Eumeta japonica]|uniref:Uncharacterized protein n=1 Tax=Eumeta variegata TaxID=151549 RepID=A0A4C1Z4L9_EUMVA|nr:hypothetical protein EVAR_65966_1 [Eumeta japonica]
MSILCQETTSNPVLKLDFRLRPTFIRSTISKSSDNVKAFPPLPKHSLSRYRAEPPDTVTRRASANGFRCALIKFHSDADRLAVYPLNLINIIIHPAASPYARLTRTTYSVKEFASGDCETQMLDRAARRAPAN